MTAERVEIESQIWVRVKADINQWPITKRECCEVIANNMDRHWSEVQHTAEYLESAGFVDPIIKKITTKNGHSLPRKYFDAIAAQIIVEAHSFILRAGLLNSPIRRRYSGIKEHLRSCGF